MNKKKLKNITRMDYEKSHDWWVRSILRISKMFSNSRYGVFRAKLDAVRYRYLRH